LNVNEDLFYKSAKLILTHHKKKGRIIIAGNGGSASIAAHICVDFAKELSIKAINFNEANLITCFANDFGYENWLKKAFEIYIQKNDMVILISSSGNSYNIINAAKYLKSRKISLITLSGFNKNNKLKKIGSINLWCNSNLYNFVEMTHYVWLVSIVDFLKSYRSINN
jgi:D-sedoheptulose 7-phosphate isomerase